MSHVVCVGQLMVDIVARLPGPIAPGSDTPAPISLLGGGAAANVAAWLAAAGAHATLVGRVGADDLGRRMIADLEAAGVVTAVDVDRDYPTGTCIVLVDPDGERTMIPDAGANAGLGRLDAASVLPSEADWLYLSGYALLDPGSRPFALGALRHAREHGWSIAVDAASSAPLTTAGAFLDWIGRDCVLFANDDEARVLTGSVGTPAARSLGARVGQAVVKRGAAGAVWSNGSSAVSAAPVATTVIDSTGAGDAFAAGYLAWPGTPDERLGAGTALASRAVGVLGARPPHPPDATARAVRRGS